MYFLHKYFPATHNCPRVTDPAVTDSGWWYWSEGPAGLLIQDSLDDDVGPDGEHSTPCVMMLMMLWLITTSLTQQYKQTMRPGLPSSWRILCLCRHKLIFQKMFVLISDSSDCIKSWFHERHETVENVSGDVWTISSSHCQLLTPPVKRYNNHIFISQGQCSLAEAGIIDQHVLSGTVYDCFGGRVQFKYEIN